MSGACRVLLVEDNPGDTRLIRETLGGERDGGFDLDCVARLADGLERAGSGAYDGVLLELGLPDSQGLETFSRLHARAPEIATLVLTGLDDRELGTRAVQEGAQDYLIKGQASGDSLIRAIHYARERARAQAAVVRSKVEWERTFDAVPDLIAILDRDHRFVRVNRAMAERLGRAPAACVGLTCYGEVHGDLAPPSFCPYRQLLADEQEHEAEVREDRLGGDFLVSVSPLRDGAGELLGCVHVARDVTLRRRAEAEIRRLNAELEERVRQRTSQLEAANHNLESFSFSISHDLRSPLRAIDGFARLLEDTLDPALDAEQVHFLDTIRANAQRMSQLIDDLLAFSRAGRQDLRRARVDMGAMVQEVWGELVARDTGPRAELRLAMLPEADADPTMIRQVWVNLLGNALKFSARRELRVVEVGGVTEQGETAYFVRDNGAGFEVRYAEKLFGVFQRLHPASLFEGSGVGLAIVREIIQRHGGRVWGSGEVDVGATFEFTLPLGHAPE